MAINTKWEPVAFDRHFTSHPYPQDFMNQKNSAFSFNHMSKLIFQRSEALLLANSKVGGVAIMKFGKHFLLKG